jgi:3-phenylpropionate/trans-cinnamate dioxygenase ferredoxin reductase subunit
MPEEWWMPGVVIVGAGQAGASAAAKLRALGHDKPVMVIGDEPVAPYQRPPLSKGYLLREMDLDRLYLRSHDFWTENRIDLRLGESVTEIDTVARTVSTDRGMLDYDDLILATGSTARRLPAAAGGDLAGVYTVRTLADADAMAHEFRKGRRLLVVGGGYIGLEAAAVAAKLGLDVTVIEMAPRILQRVAAAETSNHVRRLHLEHGVMIYEGVGLARLLGEGRVSAARLTDEREVPVDFVIVGVGITPNTGLAEAAGIETENGIRADEMGQTSAAHVWAAGDCASFPWKGGRIRLESVGNAIDMAEAVAANIMGAGTPYVAHPWFWSDQYDLKLQIAGLSTGYDRIVTRPGEDDAVSFWYYRGDELIAVDAMNDAKSYMIGKRLIEMGRSPSGALIMDPETNLKALLK